MSNIATTIESATRHSPVHDELDLLRPRWGIVDGMPVALTLGRATTDDATTGDATTSDVTTRNATVERSRAQTLALCDVSALARVVLKGPAAAGFLAAQQVAAPTDIMGVSPLELGGLIARTGGAEFFLEDGVEGQVVAKVVGAVGSATPGCYRVVRQDAAFLLSGRRAAEVFLQTCGFDFRQPSQQLVMTRVVGVSCSILHREISGIGAFQLWCDGTYGAYLWRTLVDIVRELGGDAVGVAAFFPELIRRVGPTANR